MDLGSGSRGTPMSSPPIPAVELWPHQREAITRAVAALRDGGRVSIVAACGTGKTAIGLGTADELDARRVLVVVPTLGLLEQTMAVYTGRPASRSLGQVLPARPAPDRRPRCPRHGLGRTHRSLGSRAAGGAAVRRSARTPAPGPRPPGRRRLPARSVAEQPAGSRLAAVGLPGGAAEGPGPGMGFLLGPALAARAARRAGVSGAARAPGRPAELERRRRLRARPLDRQAAEPGRRAHRRPEGGADGPWHELDARSGSSALVDRGLRRRGRLPRPGRGSGDPGEVRDGGRDQARTVAAQRPTPLPDRDARSSAGGRAGRSRCHLASAARSATPRSGGGGVPGDVGK